MPTSRDPDTDSTIEMIDWIDATDCRAYDRLKMQAEGNPEWNAALRKRNNRSFIGRYIASRNAHRDKEDLAALRAWCNDPGSEAKDEVWKPCGDGYEVSSLGRVRSLDRTVTGSDGRARHVKGKVLSPQTSYDRYHHRVDGVYVSVRAEGKPTARASSVALLVYRAFGAVDQRSDKNASGYVCHKDGDIFNNRAENLVIRDEMEFWEE